MHDLIDAMINAGTLRTPTIIDTFRAIDRADFVPSDLRGAAYEDHPLQIGHEQTISQPSTVAFMLELLAPLTGHTVLDIGSGSGWTTALLAHLVGPTGSVLGLERVQELVRFGSDNLARYGFAHARIERAGSELGSPTQAPFDRILVSAAARSFPNELVTQLCERGVLVIPVRDAIWHVVRIEHQPVIQKFSGYVFVPLITKA
jgi:protein-L-isoaspartate(D-aspartate) O-methyltransferase